MSPLIKLENGEGWQNKTTLFYYETSEEVFPLTLRRLWPCVILVLHYGGWRGRDGIAVPVSLRVPVSWNRGQKAALSAKVRRDDAGLAH